MYSRTHPASGHVEVHAKTPAQPLERVTSSLDRVSVSAGRRLEEQAGIGAPLARLEVRGTTERTNTHARTLDLGATGRRVVRPGTWRTEGRRDPYPAAALLSRAA
jgi:hypothetical protein